MSFRHVQPRDREDGEFQGRVVLGERDDPRRRRRARRRRRRGFEIEIGANAHRVAGALF